MSHFQICIRLFCHLFDKFYFCRFHIEIKIKIKIQHFNGFDLQKFFHYRHIFMEENCRLRENNWCCSICDLANCPCMPNTHTQRLKPHEIHRIHTMFAFVLGKCHTIKMDSKNIKCFRILTFKFVRVAIVIIVVPKTRVSLAWKIYVLSIDEFFFCCT